jgi:hypothetical protein
MSGVIPLVDISTATAIASAISKAIQANSAIAKSRLTENAEQCCVGYKEFFEAIESLLTVGIDSKNENIMEFTRKTMHDELLQEVTLLDIMPSYRWNRICHNMRDVLPIEDFRLIMVEYNRQTSNT